jgi:hexulose-6-phosphate isomerase
MRHKIGFMQGRLCEPVKNKIQAFPWRDWECEFEIASNMGMHLMEWTLDQERLYENPLMTAEGQKKIRQLCQQYDIFIPSLTGDCFMQRPFWKARGQTKTDLQSDFLKIVQSCSLVGIQMIVVPLVDNGRLETTEQENILIDFLLKNKDVFASHNLKIIFESDFTPAKLARFLERITSPQFGINYDIGNSAALGFNVVDEFIAFGNRVANVHVKDRVLGGTTVPLKTGNADFETVFLELSKQKYKGNFILQTARAVNGRHAEALGEYQKMTLLWMNQYDLVAIK